MTSRLAIVSTAILLMACSSTPAESPPEELPIRALSDGKLAIDDRTADRLPTEPVTETPEAVDTLRVYCGLIEKSVRQREPYTLKSQVFESPNGKYAAYVEVKCLNTDNETALYLSTDGEPGFRAMKTLRPLEPPDDNFRGNGMRIIEWSADGRYLLFETLYWANASDVFAGPSPKVFDAGTLSFFEPSVSKLVDDGDPEVKNCTFGVITEGFDHAPNFAVTTKWDSEFEACNPQYIRWKIDPVENSARRLTPKLEVRKDLTGIGCYVVGNDVEGQRAKSPIFVSPDGTYEAYAVVEAFSPLESEHCQIESRIFLRESGEADFGLAYEYRGIGGAGSGVRFVDWTSDEKMLVVERWESVYNTDKAVNSIVLIDPYIARVEIVDHNGIFKEYRGDDPDNCIFSPIALDTADRIVVASNNRCAEEGHWALDSRTKEFERLPSDFKVSKNGKFKE